MKLRLGFALLALLSLSGCDVAVVGAGSTITGNGVTKEETRSVEDFTEVSISESFEATIKVGEKPSVTLSVDENLLPLVETRVSDGRLEVRYFEGPIVVSKKTQKVSIVATRLDVITATGAAKVSASSVAGKGLRIEAGGASSVELRKHSLESLEVKADGAARVNLDGKGKTLSIESQGASKIRARDSVYESANVLISGASQCEINVTGSIAGELSGACSLNVLGNPASRSVKVSNVSRVTY